MEEDIKILEELLNTEKEYINDKVYQKEHDINKEAIECAKKWAQAIEHLIARNKELENKNKSLKKQIKLMQEYNKKAGIVYKDKIKEKIEELEKVKETTNKLFPEGSVNEYVYEGQIKILQELLEEKNDL